MMYGYRKGIYLREEKRGLFFSTLAEKYILFDPHLCKGTCSLPVREFALDPVDRSYIPEFESPSGIPLSNALSFSLLQSTQLQMRTSHQAREVPGQGGVTTPESLHVIETGISSCCTPH